MNRQIMMLVLAVVSIGYTNTGKAEDTRSTFTCSLSKAEFESRSEMFQTACDFFFDKAAEQSKKTSNSEFRFQEKLDHYMFTKVEGSVSYGRPNGRWAMYDKNGNAVIILRFDHGVPTQDVKALYY